jgi:hypothetical protein
LLLLLLLLFVTAAAASVAAAAVAAAAGSPCALRFRAPLPRLPALLRLALRVRAIVPSTSGVSVNAGWLHAARGARGVEAAV